MTNAYEADVTPDEVDIRCPRCGMAARFRFATAAAIGPKATRAALKAHPAYDLETWFESGSMRTVAIYYEALDTEERSPLNGASLARYVWRQFADRGACVCGACGLRDRHRLRWPNDALFSCEVRGQTLWAWTRSHAVALRDYIASKDRSRAKFQHALFLMHVPSHFLSAKHRREAVRQLERLLSS